MTEEQKKITVPIAEEQPKKSKKKNWIVASMGLILIILGAFSVFQTDEMNVLAVQIGSKTVTEEMIEAYPNHELVWAKAAEVIDTAIEARTTSPEVLSQLMNSEISKLTGSDTPEINEIITKIIEQVNIAWASTENEAVYIEKLKALSTGIKQALL